MYILGQGGHASSILDATNENHNAKCVDDAFFESHAIKDTWILGFGDLRKRREKIDSYPDVQYQTVIHPTATISSNAAIGNGVFVGANAYIGPNVTIGDHCIINTHAVVEHDCKIGENVHISVNTTLCGQVHVGKDSFVGAGTVVIPKITIGSEVHVGAGTKVGQNVESSHFCDEFNFQLRHSACSTKEKKKEWKWCATKPLSMDNISNILKASIVSNHFTNNGPVVKELEGFIETKFQLQKKVHMAVSGTGALHALIAGINIFHHRTLRYATQAFSFASAILGPLKNSIIIDNDAKFLGPSLKMLEERKNDFDGIIVTNVFGCICDIRKYRQWCDENSKILLFDNAATPMAFFDGKNVCDIADASIVSFHETKFFGRGEGGAVICSEKLWPYINRAVNFGFHFGFVVREFHIEASNWRMSDFSAAFIYSHLQSIFEPANIHKTFEVSEKVRDIIRHSPFSFLFRYPEKTVLSGICLRAEHPISSEIIRRVSLQTGIELKKYYVPLTSKENAPTAWSFYERVICFPFHFQISEQDVFQMIEKVTLLLNGK